MHPITLIPGDGIGPEVASNVVRIIEASGVEVQWETYYAGAQALEKFGETLPQELLDSILRDLVAQNGIEQFLRQRFAEFFERLRARVIRFPLNLNAGRFNDPHYV